MTQLSAAPDLATVDISHRAAIEQRLLHQALSQPAFRQRLREAPDEVWRDEFGETAIASFQLYVFESTEDIAYIVLPSHDAALRNELLHHPQRVWQREFGTTRLAGQVIRVVDEQPGQFCLVLPWVEDAAAMALWMNEHPPDVQNPLSNKPDWWVALKQRSHQGKLGRILYRGQAWSIAQVKRTPVVSQVLRPIYRVRSWFYSFRRL